MSKQKKQNWDWKTGNTLTEEEIINIKNKMNMAWSSFIFIDTNGNPVTVSNENVIRTVCKYGYKIVNDAN